MQRTTLFFLLVIFSEWASADTVWRGTSPHSSVNGSGDITGPMGAAVSLSGESTGTEGFIGAITSIDAHGYRGQEVVLAGTLQVKQGVGSASLWGRADGPNGRIAFESSAGEPVRSGDGAQTRKIRLYVPLDSTRLKLGATLASAGHVGVEEVTLKAEAATVNGVSAYGMLDHAIAVIQANALNASRVDWNAERAVLLADELKELPSQEAYSRIQEVLVTLEDRHSSIRGPKRAMALRESAIATQPIEASSMQDIGYLLVPGLSGTDLVASRAFTAQLCKQVASLAPTSPRGWIIDLRANPGGNMWPMINGLHSFLGSANVGAIKERDGVVTPWQSTRSDACSVELSRSRVAVLVGPRTASSGEAVAVAFRGRPETSFFGEPTAGLSTSNRSFDLPDGGVLALTTAVFTDRSGVEYPRGIQPENFVPADQNVIQAATEWLRASP